MRKFKRSIHSIVTSILLVIFIFSLIEMVLVGYAEGNLFVGDTLTPTEFKLALQCYFFLAMWGISLFIIPPDFNYFIRVFDDRVIFEISEEDHRRINRNFVIVSKKRHHIVLDDGFSRICIAYNKEVLQFLNEINNWWFRKKNPQQRVLFLS